MAGRRRRQGSVVAAAAAPFVEREQELGVLRGLLKSAKAGRGNLVVITGEPGIGKTRLANRFAVELRSPSVAALWARCHSDPDTPAFWPWKQIIARHAERRDDATLLQELGAGARDVVPLIPQLASRFPELARPPSHEPPEARQRVFEGMVGFVRAAARDQALLIVMDDLHWIDDSSLSLLELAASESHQSRVLIVAACRPSDFGSRQTEARVASLWRKGHHIALEGLNETGSGS
jgi:predicted ATPase